jgi:hypothetical protein
MVKDINQSALPVGSYPSSFASVGANVLFTAYEPGSGTELWRTIGRRARPSS